MRLDNGLDGNPLFRKPITPWYDHAIACWLLVAAMAGVSLFSWFGIHVARTHPFYDAYIWVPMVLLVLSLLVAGSVIWRLLHRYYTFHLKKGIIEAAD
jgi:hypothetical protein